MHKVEAKVQAALAFGGPLKPLDRQDLKKNKADENVKHEGMQAVSLVVMAALIAESRTLSAGSTSTSSREQWHEHAEVASRSQRRKGQG